MSIETATPPVAHEHDDHHPTDALFIKTAVILAVITAVEVAWSYLPWGDGIWVTLAEVGGLLIMMAWKFFIVANVFMHLKFDNKLLTGVFYSGVALAVGVYLIALITFELFSSGTPSFVG